MEPTGRPARGVCPTGGSHPHAGSTFLGTAPGLPAVRAPRQRRPIRPVPAVRTSPRRLVPSRTTLLGLVKHATFVEKVWFDEAVTCRSRAEIGIPATPDESFILDDEDTIATAQLAHREACEASRRATSPLGLDDMVHGNRRGPLPLRWVYLHVLRELAQPCGHADILREQLINE